MRLVLLAAVAALLAGCGGSAAPSDSGIQGRAILAPACPVEPCPRPPPPYGGSFVVRDGAEVVATVRTDRRGRFLVRLAPGRYVLQSHGEGLPFLKPIPVAVREHEFTDVILRFDSGIR